MWDKAKVQEKIKKNILNPLVRKGLSNSFIDLYDRGFSSLWAELMILYGTRYDFLYQLEDLVGALARSYMERPASLQQLDRGRLPPSVWYEDSNHVGMMLYIDLFSGDILSLESKLDYFNKLGITFIHLMPLFESPTGDSDGGYAVTNYQKVNPSLGRMEDLAYISGKMREKGMSLVLDFILNHTADNHLWARKAKAGEKKYREYYFIFPSREQADEYDSHLREIFPSVRRGSFTYDKEAGGWVWTTFNSFQWDLNYANPEVFISMVEQMLFLANQGAEVLRLDALAFCWKEKGTSCESLPKVHNLIRAFKAAAAITCPSLAFLSEAIVHPDEIVKYISKNECELSYNPLIMATIWESLATRNTRLLSHSLEKRYSLPKGCEWVNYLRCHDDIGWTFCDDDAADLKINGYDHRRFLNEFYTGHFPGSFARGVPFQENPATGDARVSGTLASLAGLEKALKEETSNEVEIALKRIKLLWGVLLSLPGIPLLYSGDEKGMLNAYYYIEDPSKSKDSRWVHRIPFSRKEEHFLGPRILDELRRMIALRKKTKPFEGELEVQHGEDSSLLVYRCRGEGEVLVIANFSEKPLNLSLNTLRLWLGGYKYRDLLSDLVVEDPLTVEGYDVFWLRRFLR